MADSEGMRRAAVAAGLTAFLLAGCGKAPSPTTDPAVLRFCADTAGLQEMLGTPGSGPSAIARLTDFDRRLSADVVALQQAGDATVAAEAQLIQSIVAGQIAAGELGAGPNAQLGKAASMLADLRDKTC
jgi:hypothetical protein